MIDIEGIVSSEPRQIFIREECISPPCSLFPNYLYTAATMYITQVLEGKEYVEPGDTVILHNNSPLASSDKRWQPGAMFHLRGTYLADTGVMEWTEVIKELGKTTAYEPPPVVGRSGDFVQVVVIPGHLSTNTLPGLLVSNHPNGTPFLQLISMDQARVVTDTVRLGEVVGDSWIFVEVLKTQR